MSMLSAMEQAAVDRLDGDTMLARTEQWAAINSGTRHLAGVARMASALADAFSVLPGALSLVDADPVEAVDGNGNTISLEHGRHLLLTVRPAAPVQLLLTGHMDTVYPAGHPFQHVTHRADGIVNGPGVADMKGGLSLMLAALQAVEASPVAPRLGYRVLVNSDEETGSLSSAALIARQAQGCTAALTYEPALADGTLAGARGGSGNVALAVRGRSAHAGRNPRDGRNALVAAADLALRLAAGAGEDLSVNPARIEGGGPNNVVPALAVLHVNVRPRDAAAVARVTHLLGDTIAAVAQAHEVTITRHGGITRPPKPIDAGAARLQALIARVGAALGQPIAWRDTGGVCDGNNIAAAGVPVVDTMGVRGGAIHSPEEYMVTDSLRERAALSVVTMLRLAEGLPA